MSDEQKQDGGEQVAQPVERTETRTATHQVSEQPAAPTGGQETATPPEETAS